MSGESGTTRKGAAAPKLTLIERAAEVYDLGLSRGQDAPLPQASQPEPNRSAPAGPAADQAVGWSGPLHPINHLALREHGFIDRDSPATGLSEEFRIIKRQILTQLFDGPGGAHAPLVLVNSAHPGDGKTWTTINLALSLSAESDLDVLLIDADFGKPDICARLGLPAGPGLMDALTDPSIDVGRLVMRTDVPSLSVLPAGQQVNNDTEVLASDRTRAVLDQLIEGHPRRLVLLDSPPALAASAASELARHVALVLLVVRADRTSDAALRDAVHLLAACPNIQAVLNGVKFSSSGRLFGAYYGKRN